VNWKHAIGEVLLIVVGITIAIALDSAWKDRQARSQETALLAQILVTLELDYETLESQLARVTKREKLLTDLLQSVKNGQPYSDDLAENFRVMRQWQTTQINTSPYEDLKASGLDLVSNHVLRQQLINFYDRQLQRLVDRDETDRMQNLREVQPFLQTRIRWNGVPLDYEVLVQDNEFMYILEHRISAVSTRTVPLYEKTVAQARELVSSLKVQLADRK
jgi:hypothetical protein